MLLPMAPATGRPALGWQARYSRAKNPMADGRRAQDAVLPRVNSRAIAEGASTLSSWPSAVMAAARSDLPTKDTSATAKGKDISPGAASPSAMSSRP